MVCSENTKTCLKDKVNSGDTVRYTKTFGAAIQVRQYKSYKLILKLSQHGLDISDNEVPSH